MVMTCSFWLLFATCNVDRRQCVHISNSVRWAVKKSIEPGREKESLAERREKERILLNTTVRFSFDEGCSFYMTRIVITEIQSKPETREAPTPTVW